MNENINKQEKLTRLEEQLYENTILKKNKTIPSAETLDKLQEKIESKANEKKESRKNEFINNLKVSKEIFKRLDKIHSEINDNNNSDSNIYEMVNHPKHYNNYDIEVIDMMERIWGINATIQFCEMNAFKYRMRIGTKPNQPIEQDLEKEKWYLDKAKQLKSKN